MFKQSVTNLPKDCMRKRVKLRRGEANNYQFNQLKASKVLAIDNRIQGIYSNIDTSNVENRKRLNKSAERFPSQLKEKMIDSTCYSTSNNTPKILNNINLQVNSNSIEILELQNKVDNLHLLDLKVSEIGRKANNLIQKSQEARNNIFGNKSCIEADSFIESSDDEDTPEGMYYGQIKKCRPQGKGVLKINDTIIFEGRWSKGKYHGQGKQTNLAYNTLTETYYIKNIEDKLDRGIIPLENWKYYKGNFYFGKKNNRGVLILGGEFEVHGCFNKNYIYGQIKLFNKYNTLVLTQVLNKPVLIK